MKLISQRIQCECYDYLTCVSKPARRVFRRQNDADTSSVNIVLQLLKNVKTPGINNKVKYKVCAAHYYKYQWLTHDMIFGTLVRPFAAKACRCNIPGSNPTRTFDINIYF